MVPQQQHREDEAAEHARGGTTMVLERMVAAFSILEFIRFSRVYL